MIYRGAVLFTLIFLLGTHSSIAQRNSITVLPRKPGAAGFRVNIEADSVGGPGYHPFYFTFTPLGKSFGGDRTVQIELSPRRNYREKFDLDYTFTVDIPSGVPSHRSTVYLPSFVRWESLVVRLYENGRQIEDATSTRPGDLRSKHTSHQTAIGVIEPRDSATSNEWWKKYPDVRSLITVFGDGPISENVAPTLTAKATKRLAERVQPAFVQFRTIQESSLHKSWLGYSQLDVIIVASKVLARIETEQADELIVIKDWIAQGGNLWVYGSDANEVGFLKNAKLQVAKTSRIPNATASAKRLKLSKKNDTSQLTETYQGVEKQSRNYSYSSSPNSMENRQTAFNNLKKKKNPMTVTVQPQMMAAKLRFGKFGGGTLTHIADENPFPGSFQLWHAVQDLHYGAFSRGSPRAAKQLNWVARNGVNLFDAQDTYWALMIGAVGQPPVKSFIFLNALFVILIGPVCYIVLKQRERLYLIFFVAPALALLVTIGLFMYALVADGFQAQVRARQVSWLDSDAGYMLTHSRAMYFSLLGSGSGLKFDPQSTVYPVRFDSGRLSYRGSRMDGVSGKGYANDKTQALSGSFLPARQQAQFLSVHPIRTAGKLSFDFSANQESVTNNTQHAIKRLILADRSGAYWFADSIEPGAKATLKASTGNVAPSLGAGEFAMPIPAGAAQPNAPLVPREISMVEAKIESMLKKLSPGQYLALADVNTNLLGLEGAKLSQSEHILGGELP